MDPILTNLAGVVCLGLALSVGLIAAIAFVARFLAIGRPNELLVFSGRSSEGTLMVGGGWRVRIPLIEQVDRMDLTCLPVDIRVTNAYSLDGIALNVHAVANVKINPDETRVRNAVERFMGEGLGAIRRVAKETLEGHLRGVLSSLTPEQVNEDRLKFADALVDEAREDLDKLGLMLDTLKIQNVSDQSEYLDSIGRARIAEVVRDAEIAETTAMATAQEAEADARQRGEVAVQQSQTAIVRQENELRKLRAELEAEARAEEERAEASARQARAQAERELLEIRRRLEEIRLRADVVLPAEAERRAAALRAQGAAAAIEKNGEAMAAVLQMMTEAWLRAGPDARDIFLIQQLEEIMRTVTARLSDLELDEVVLLDSGDGQALPRHIASFPASVRQVLEELARTTGVDVTGILSGTTRPALSSNSQS